jgi:DNA polymerase-3 subunit beta
MELTVKASDLTTALARVVGLADKKGTMPILSNVLLEACGGLVKPLLKMRTTNLDISLETSVPATVEAYGTICVPVHTLRDAVKRFKGEVQITLDGANLIVRSGRSRFKLVTFPAADFPQLIDIKNITNNFSLPNDHAKDLFVRPAFSASHDGSRYYINGVFLQPREKTLRAVSTDGHRLACIDVPLPEGASGFKGPDGALGVIVPNNTLVEIERLVKEGGAIAVEISKSAIRLHTDNTTMVSKVVDASFPDYERVIPKDATKVLSVSRKDLADSIQRMQVIGSKTRSAIKLDASAGILEVSANNPDAGDAHDELDAVWGHEPIIVGFQSKYILDLLNATEAENVDLAFKSHMDPMIFRGEGDSQAMFVLMPVRV